MENPEKEGESLHSKLWGICRKLPQDYEPYGTASREGGEGGEGWCGDCSCGCLYYLPLEGKPGYDWGVCRNPQSHRCGLLTFEHQGCRHFTPAENGD